MQTARNSDAQVALLAEQAVIASLIIDPGYLEEVKKAVSHGGFFLNQTYGKLYNTMLELHEADIPITVASIFQKEKTIPLSAIATLLSDFPPAMRFCSVTGAYAPEYARIVSEQHVRRELLKKISDKESIEDVLATAERLGKQGLDRFFNSRDIALSLFEKFQTQQTFLPYPFFNLQDATGGIRRGQTVIIAARPGVGKSSFLQQIALELALNKQGRILFASAEMSMEMISMRFASYLSGINTFTEMQKSVDKRDVQPVTEAMAQIRETKLYIHEMTSTTQLEKKLRDYGAELDVVIVDYLQLVEPKAKYKNMYERVTHTINELTQMAQKYNLPFLIACQYNRVAQKFQPTLADLRDSGQIEQNADVVISLWSDKKLDSIDTQKQRVRLDLLKNRNGYTFMNIGDNPRYSLMFHGSRFHFYENYEYEKPSANLPKKAA